MSVILRVLPSKIKNAHVLFRNKEITIGNLHAGAQRLNMEGSEEIDDILSGLGIYCAVFFIMK